MPRTCRIPPVRVAAGVKFCFQCSTAKPNEQFATDRKAWDALRPMCRSCDASRVRAYRAKKAERSVADRIAQSRRNWHEIKAGVEASLGC